MLCKPCNVLHPEEQHECDGEINQAPGDVVDALGIRPVHFLVGCAHKEDARDHEEERRHVLECMDLEPGRVLAPPRLLAGRPVVQHEANFDDAADACGHQRVAKQAMDMRGNHLCEWRNVPEPVHARSCPSRSWR